MEQRIRDHQKMRSSSSIRKRSVRRRAMRRKRRIYKRILLATCALILIFGFTYFMMYRSVSKYPEDKICKNIYIGSVDVSNMTKKQALQSMEDHLTEGKQAAVVMKVGEQEAQTTLDDLGLTYKQIKKTVNTAYKYGKSGSLWHRYWKLRKLSKKKLVLDEDYVLTEKSAKKVIKKQAVPLANHAVNATIEKSGDGFNITDEQEGVTVNIKKSIAKIEKKVNDGWNNEALTVKMSMKKEKPTITKASLETISDKLGSYSTDAGGGERRQNLKTGVSKLNGTILAPGQEVSVHDITAPYEKDNGYVAAGSYENGKVVETYGGGICQVSTTLYNAVLYAELEVTERYPHSMLVAYIDPSRDAAIAGDVKDLKFKNNYETPIYIEGYIDDNNQLTFNIYGKDTREKGRTVEYESETTSTEEYGKTYKEDSSASLGSISYSGSPHTGKTAKLWKIVKKDGKQVSKDVVNESSYAKSDQIILVGTKSDNSRASGIVSSAIGTQDGSKINAAISKAQAME